MTNETKQTAVQILVDSLIKLGYLHSKGFGQSLKVTEVINQAKAMEKEQRDIDYSEGYKDGYSRATDLAIDKLKGLITGGDPTNEQQ